MTTQSRTHWLEPDPDLRHQVPAGTGAVILNPGNKSGSVLAKSLGACLTEALQGGTEAVAILVGYWGLSHIRFDDEGTIADDNPASILAREAFDEDDLRQVGADGSAQGSVDLLVGQVTDDQASFVLRAWYWLCRWRHESGHDHTTWLKELHRGPQEKQAKRDHVEWVATELQREVTEAFAAWTPSGDGDTELFQEFRETCATSPQGRTSAWMVIYLLLQRRSNLYMWDSGSTKEGIFHPKIYLVQERDSTGGSGMGGAETPSTWAFVGSNNLSARGLGGDGGGNVELALVHREVGECWTNSASAGSMVANIAAAARALLASAVPLGLWDRETDPLSAKRMLELTTKTQVQRVATDDDLAPPESPEPSPAAGTRTATSPYAEVPWDLLRWAGPLRHTIEHVLGLQDVPRFALYAEAFRSRIHFGGFAPSDYQIEGAMRLLDLMGAIGNTNTPKFGRFPPRGAFLTDEPGLGKTAIGQMVATYLATERLVDLSVNSADSKWSQPPRPVRVTCIAPARLAGNNSSATNPEGWAKHAAEIKVAVRTMFMTVACDKDPAFQPANVPWLADDSVWDDVVQVRALSIQGLARGQSSSKAGSLNINEDALDDFVHLALSDVVVVDESHNLRSPTARSTKVFRLLTSLPLPGEDWPIYVDHQRVISANRARIGVLPGSPDGAAGGDAAGAGAGGSVPMNGHGRRMLLMSATPFNNRLEDFTTQLGHYLRVQIWPKIKPEQARQVLEQARMDSDELTMSLPEALTSWVWMDAGDARAHKARSRDVAWARTALSVILQHSAAFIVGGRTLDLTDEKTDQFAREAQRPDQLKPKDDGPVFQWHVSLQDELSSTLSDALKNLRAVREESRNPARPNTQLGVVTEPETDEPTRVKIDGILARCVVQRSRRRVLRGIKDAEQRKAMFRQPDLPRHPLPLERFTAEDRRNSFEAIALKQLREILGIGGQSAQTSGSLSLFAYEVAVLRGRERSGTTNEGDSVAIANAIGFQAIGLIKRLQSSPWAFLLTVVRGLFRRTLYEVALVEGLVDELQGDDRLPEVVQRACQKAQGVLRQTLNNRLNRERVEAVVGLLGGEVATQESTAYVRPLIGIHSTAATRNGLLEGRYKKDLEWLVTTLRAPGSGADLPDSLQRVVNDLLRFSTAQRPEETESRLQADLLIALNWVVSPVVTHAFSGSGALFAELYGKWEEKELLLPKVALAADGLQPDMLGASGAISEPDDGLERWRPTESDMAAIQRRMVMLRQSVAVATPMPAPSAWANSVLRMGQWVHDRLTKDKRLQSVVAWLTMQALERKRGGDPPAGIRTLLFSEYSDTLDYLSAVIATLGCFVELTASGGPMATEPDCCEERRELLGTLAMAILAPRTSSVGAGNRTDAAGLLEKLRERVGNIQQADGSRHAEYAFPLSTGFATWLGGLSNSSSDNGDSERNQALSQAVLEVAGTLGIVTSKQRRRLWEGSSESASAGELSDGQFDYGVDEDAAEVTITAGDILDAFSPWYQIAPKQSDGQSEEAALRLRQAAMEPVYTLLATEVLSEGVNLQECGVVVHYDLPWNPTRLIQRNGRVDRRIDARYEDHKQRSELAANLGLNDSTAPPFTPPTQVYHFTVEPVEPLIPREGEPDSREIANQVRARLFDKLDTIRTLFGLTSWPVVISEEDARKVLEGDLEFETPGFARREALFEHWHSLRSAESESSLSSEAKPELTDLQIGLSRQEFRRVLTLAFGAMPIESAQPDTLAAWLLGPGSVPLQPTHSRAQSKVLGSQNQGLAQAAIHDASLGAGWIRWYGLDTGLRISRELGSNSMTRSSEFPPLEDLGFRTVQPDEAATNVAAERVSPGAQLEVLAEAAAQAFLTAIRQPGSSAIALCDAQPLSAAAPDGPSTAYALWAHHAPKSRAGVVDWPPGATGTESGTAPKPRQPLNIWFVLNESDT